MDNTHQRSRKKRNKSQLNQKVKSLNEIVNKIESSKAIFEDQYARKERSLSNARKKLVRNGKSSLPKIQSKPKPYDSLPNHNRLSREGRKKRGYESSTMQSKNRKNSEIGKLKKFNFPKPNGGDYSRTNKLRGNTSKYGNANPRMTKLPYLFQRMEQNNQNRRKRQAHNSRKHTSRGSKNAKFYDSIYEQALHDHRQRTRKTDFKRKDNRRNGNNQIPFYSDLKKKKSRDRTKVSGQYDIINRNNRNNRRQKKKKRESDLYHTKISKYHNDDDIEENRLLMQRAIANDIMEFEERIKKQLSPSKGVVKKNKHHKMDSFSKKNTPKQIVQKYKLEMEKEQNKTFKRPIMYRNSSQLKLNYFPHYHEFNNNTSKQKKNSKIENVKLSGRKKRLSSSNSSNSSISSMSSSGSSSNNRNVNSMNDSKRFEYVALDDEKKVLLVTKFLTECNFCLSSPISPMIDEYLDYHVILYIFSFLTRENIVKMGYVCKSFYSLSCNNWIWRCLSLYKKESKFVIFNKLNLYLYWKRLYYNLPFKSSKDKVGYEKELKKQFIMFDSDNDNLISVSDFASANEHFGWKFDESEINDLVFDFQDYHDKGGITYESFEEFLSVVEEKIQTKRKHRIIKSFEKEFLNVNTIDAFQ